MENYKIEGRLGSGAFGIVYSATFRKTGMKVAIKRMRRRYSSWEECLELREVQALRLLRHPALVQLLAVIREKERLFLVFEFVGPNLYDITRDRIQPLPEMKIKSILRQALQGLAQMHAAGYVHRDIKPENLLMRGSILKISDFGLVRQVHGPSAGKDEDGQPWTEYVSTRWYRAPEVLLRSPVYGPPVDIYAIGAVAAELFSLRPLFPGSSETDQLACIAAIMGPPTSSSWPEGLKLAANIGLMFPDASMGSLPSPKRALREVLPGVCDNAIDLISRMCSWDPAQRPTAEEALQHPYFARTSAVLPPLPLGQVSVMAQQLRGAAERLGKKSAEEEAEEKPTLKKLAQRASKRQRALLKRRKSTRESVYKEH